MIKTQRYHMTQRVGEWSEMYTGNGKGDWVAWKDHENLLIKVAILIHEVKKDISKTGGNIRLEEAVSNILGE